MLSKYKDFFLENILVFLGITCFISILVYYNASIPHFDSYIVFLKVVFFVLLVDLYDSWNTGEVNLAKSIKNSFRGMLCVALPLLLFLISFYVVYYVLKHWMDSIVDVLLLAALLSQFFAVFFFTAAVQAIKYKDVYLYKSFDLSVTELTFSEFIQMFIGLCLIAIIQILTYFEVTLGKADLLMMKFGCSVSYNELCRNVFEISGFMVSLAIMVWLISISLRHDKGY